MEVYYTVICFLLKDLVLIFLLLCTSWDKHYDIHWDNVSGVFVYCTFGAAWPVAYWLRFLWTIEGGCRRLEHIVVRVAAAWFSFVFEKKWCIILLRRSATCRSWGTQLGHADKCTSSFSFYSLFLLSCTCAFFTVSVLALSEAFWAAVNTE